MNILIFSFIIPACPCYGEIEKNVKLCRYPCLEMRFLPIEYACHTLEKVRFMSRMKWENIISHI